jgi:hypothetical protein
LALLIRKNVFVQSKIPLKKLLAWRFEKAKAEAPLAPRAARLLELTQPWEKRRQSGSNWQSRG